MFKLSLHAINLSSSVVSCRRLAAVDYRLHACLSHGPLTTSVFRFRGLGNAYTWLSYLAFLFSVSIRSLAAGPDEADFCPVIGWRSATV